MNVTFAAQPTTGGAWWGAVTNESDQSRWIEVHAEPSVPMGATVTPAGGWLAAGATMLVGFQYHPWMRLLMFDDPAAPPGGVVTLDQPFPTGPGFRVVWGEGDGSTSALFQDGLPERWAADGTPADGP